MISPVNRISLKPKIALFFILISLLPVVTGYLFAQNEETDGRPMTLKESIEESLQLEKQLLADLEKDRNRVRELEPTLAVELEAYKVLHTTYTNMLARQIPDPESLEQASANVKAAIIRIRERLNTLNKGYDAIRPMRNGLQDQLDTNAAYLKEIKNARKTSPDEAKFIKNLQALIDTINKKRQYLDELNDFYQSSITNFGAVQENLTSLSNKLEAGINQSRKNARFTRKSTLFASGVRTALKEEISTLIEQLNRLLSVSNIKSEIRLMWKSAGQFMAFPVLIFLLVMILAFRLRRFYPKVWENPAFEECPAFRLAWRVFNRSIFLLVVTLSLFAFSQINSFYIPVHIVIFFDLLQLYLFTQWALDMVAGVDQLERFDMDSSFAGRLRSLVVLVRFYISAYIVVAQLLPSGSVLLAWARLFFEILLIGWCMHCWRKNRQQSSSIPDQNRALRKKVIKLVAYLISFGGLGIEIAGYGEMAFFWYASWGRTLIIGLWATLLYAALRELALIYQVIPDQDKDIAEASGRPVTWLFLKLGQPVVLVLFLVAVILAWGGKRTFLVGLLNTIRHSYRIGSIEFSIMGFVYALLVLLLTHIIAQSWRHVFQQKLLARSGMVVGLQESLTTISVYVLWGLGVLVSLNFIGLNTTTLAVAFGALGIGLGFGLQNIFNNFVSGIILLLERPIQVGDDIQVNDVWATVRKINVRSTIVQTYDNASLIIPNSDLISNQVTNWSFKDKRLRRNILVGVAYGSDIELVRQTLLEAADSTPRVLKQPKPDVVFKDFGDNALVFNLRFWTHIAYFLSVETDVRFTIDRLFRERDIVIAFPQRDIHVFYENHPGQEIK